MGDFAAHLFEGLLFLFIGLWWTFHIFRSYIQALETEQTYRSYLSYHVVVYGRKIPVETIFFKMFCPFIGLITDLFNEHWRFIDDDGNFQRIVGLQHIVIHTLFVIHGVSDLMEYYKLPTIKGMKYFTFSVAFLWFSVEFYFHSDEGMHKAPLENQLHRLGIPLTTLVGVAVLMEFYNREQIFPQLLRSFSSLCTGIWYIYMAHVLFLPTPFPGRKHNPDWDQHDERNVHFIVAAFGLNIIFVIIFMMTSFVAMVICHRSRCFDRFFGNSGKANYHYMSLKDCDRLEPALLQEKDKLVNLDEDV